jgi:hypothetical protein
VAELADRRRQLPRFLQGDAARVRASRGIPRRGRRAGHDPVRTPRPRSRAAVRTLPARLRSQGLHADTSATAKARHRHRHAARGARTAGSRGQR